ncbi:chloride channel protein [bacterium]|nr:chloride channel protein [bacterium]
MYRNGYWKSLNGQLVECFRWIVAGVFIGTTTGGLIYIFQLFLFLGIEAISPALSRLWGVILLPPVGLFLSGLIISKSSRRTRHGLVRVFAAVHREKGTMGILSIPVEILAYTATVAFGGSGGREGPAIMVSAAWASNLGRLPILRRISLRYVVIAGVAASFSALFNAPIAGAVFGAELFFLNNIEYRSIALSGFASISAHLVYIQLLPNALYFSIPSSIHNYNLPPKNIVTYILLGILSGVVSSFWTRFFRTVQLSFSRWKKKLYLKTAFAGVILSILYAINYIFIGKELHIWGLGYETINALFENPGEIAPLVIIFLLAGKIVATGLTVGSGAAGGLVLPTFFIGAAVGAFFGQLPLGIPPEIASVAGALSFFASSTNTPLAMTIFSAEAAGIPLVLPTMVASLVGHIISRKDSIFTEAGRFSKQRI